MKRDDIEALAAGPGIVMDGWHYIGLADGRSILGRYVGRIGDEGEVHLFDTEDGERVRVVLYDPAVLRVRIAE